MLHYALKVFVNADDQGIFVNSQKTLMSSSQKGRLDSWIISESINILFHGNSHFFLV